jgi:Lar family restriction alleviation protein
MKKKVVAPMLPLKNCPFCGNNELETDEDILGIYIKCQSCFARGPAFKRPTHDNKILPAWNTRVTE